MGRTLAVVMVALASLLLASCGKAANDQAAPSPTVTESPATGQTTTSTGSCVEQHSLDALKKRDYAFDGTIKRIEPAAGDSPDTVVFSVAAWYRGGAGAEATRKAYGFGAVTSAGGSPRKVGDHLLVAGDDDFIWECGFTQPYDEDTAAEWAEVFEP